MFIEELLVKYNQALKYDLLLTHIIQLWYEYRMVIEQ